MSSTQIVADFIAPVEISSGVSDLELEHEMFFSPRALPGPKAVPYPWETNVTKAYRQPSPWSHSAGKRVLDCGLVLLALPLALPVFVLIAIVVRLNSRGPVLFLQQRVGCNGRRFTIFKFRTMIHTTGNGHQPVTTTGDQRFTSVGPLLRRWKLDEVPQLLNVLLGHMSLVGPRPKVPEHVSVNLPCRPGITGAATIAFAQEEMILERVPKIYLHTFYHSVVLSAKRRLDSDYMAGATFSSDLKLIRDSILRKWDTSIMEGLLHLDVFGSKPSKFRVGTSVRKIDNSGGRSVSISREVFIPESGD